VLFGVAIIAAAAFGIAAMAPRGDIASSPAAAWSAVATDTIASGPTPAFASFRDEQLLLPVPVADITAVVFHQSSFNDTYAMTSLVAIRSASEAKTAVDAERKGGVAAWPRAEAAADGDGVWTGSALQLWRTNVAGKRDTALDCGAKPGTPVFSPVDGTVMRIRAYKLYWKYDDYEIQIQPDAWGDVDVFVLHVTDPTVTEGDMVEAGVTQIASVRNLAAKISGLQLRSYTTEGGNHTHVQLVKVPKPDEPWIVGQDPPGFKRRGN
jgi:murein DD-endopeptidase MepM/ murein hydrolase activator NlpD